MALPPAIRNTPELGRWVRLTEDRRVVIQTGKVEIGQGIKTALAIIAAEELDVALERIDVRTADTDKSPDEGYTTGSLSIQDGGSAIRVAAATARAELLRLAAHELDVPIAELTVNDGTVSGATTNRQIDYWQLAGDGFDLNIREDPLLKSPTTYRLVGQSPQRIDLEAKVTGGAAYVHDLRLPDMRHGRLIKPPTPASTLVTCPDRLNMPGVQIVRNGTFAGVVATGERDAIRAAERLKMLCEWNHQPIDLNGLALRDYLKASALQSQRIVDGTPVGPQKRAAPSHAYSGITLQASYFKPYTCHAALGPSAAVAQYVDDTLTVYTHSQGVGPLRVALAQVLQLAPERIRVIHHEGSGCYGHNGADDVALDAAILAMACAPDPISVKWTCADEFGFEPFAPAMLGELEASLDDQGNVLHWRHEVYSFSHVGRPGPSRSGTNLQSAWWLDPPHKPVPRVIVPRAEVCAHRNLQPLYAFDEPDLVEHLAATGPLRTSAFRGLGAIGNVFAIESFIDELAIAAEIDAFEFRLKHLTDRRARAVLERLRDKLPSTLNASAANTGRGIAIARYANTKAYCAVGVHVRVDGDATVKLLNAVIVADAGLAVDPDGLINQLQGGFIQAASIALREEVTWDRDGVTSRDWDTYRILRFSDVPPISTHLISDPHEPALGAGEASTGPTPPAIANAIFSATGVRIREMPFTPQKLRDAAARNASH